MLSMTIPVVMALCVNPGAWYLFVPYSAAYYVGNTTTSMETTGAL